MIGNDCARRPVRTRKDASPFDILHLFTQAASRTGLVEELWAV